MGTDTASTSASGDSMLGRGKSIGIAVLQLVLIPVLAFVGFGFFFVGVGLSPDGGDAIGVREIAVLVLYGFVGLTVLVLLIGAPLLLIARASDRPGMERRAAYLPLAFAMISVVILVGLAVAGFVFQQVAAP